ncbi:AAA family ATPase [Nocardia thailandica]|uniref:AAA family ATPase n=1 Tax=Nocardia thailandica TaxID=257275 RepID=UPI0003046BFD|nr:DUF3696 domain-containing protein [Nocardia thailandica]
MIDGITLRNFKAFAEITVPLKRLTLLTGLNSSGKSTVLQAFALMRQVEFVPGIGGHAVALNGEYVELGLGRDVRHEAWIGAGAIEVELHSDVVAPDGRRGWGHWSAEYRAEEDMLLIRSGSGAIRALEPQGEPGGERRHRVGYIPEAITGSGFQYLRADRISPAASYLRSTVVQSGFLGARGEHAVNYLRIHQDDEVDPALRHSDAVGVTLLRQVEAWLGDLCPGVNLQATGIDGTDAVRLSYSQGTAGLSSSNRYRPTNVGFGLTYVLPIVIACLTARRNGLILLENPEAHLHPRGQSAMAQLIACAAATGAQVIVESHSDHVLNGLRIAVKRGVITPEELQLLYFRMDDNGVRRADPITVLPSGAIEAWPPGFFDEWDHALDALID